MSECVVRMEMPEACADCPFMEDHLDHVSCLVTGSHEGYRFKHLINRMENCPIICQLPEVHGRLVDAEILRAKLIEHIAETNCFYHAFKETPTIVPAERSATCLD